jgi:hypothetical protein
MCFNSAFKGLKRCNDPVNQKWNNSILTVKIIQSLNNKLKLISRTSKFFQCLVCNPLLLVTSFRPSEMQFTTFVCVYSAQSFPHSSLAAFFSSSLLEIEWFLISVSNLAQRFLIKFKSGDSDGVSITFGQFYKHHSLTKYEENSGSLSR